MNKLVSKNPVQRFKQGRKIVKAQGGLDTGTLNGRKVTKKGGIWTYDDTNSPIAGIDNKKVITGTGTKKKVSRTRLFPEEVDKNYTHNYLELLRKGYRPNKNGGLREPTEKKPKVSSPGSSSISRRPLKTKEQWESEFSDAKNQLSAQQLMYLDSLGIDTNSAEKMQQSINAYNKDSGLIVDNKWGDKSNAALSKILSSMPSNYKNEDTQWGLDNEKNVPDVVPTKPVINLGYRTSNTYENNDFSDRLRNMGIRSNADLIDFMYRTNGKDYNWNGDNWARQFRSDVNQALGGDYSDANIRKTFHTKNGWGGGFLGGGDFTDFQNALQTNAGVWNGMYERNLGNYVKNIDWSKFKLYKQGGQLISRNPVKRFKQKNFRLVAQ